MKEEISAAIAYDISCVLRKASDHLHGLYAEGRSVVRAGTGFGELSDDTEIWADQELGFVIAAELSGKQFYARRISVEGAEDTRLPFGALGSVWYCVDPLDGSLNYRRSCEGISLPYCGVITALEAGDACTFRDIIAAAVIRYDSYDGTIVSASRHGDTEHLNKKCRTLAETSLDLRSMIVIGEMYYPENREKLCRAFNGERGWLRNPGSAAFEMALVATGVAAAFVCDRQKQHELGAGYLLVKRAGGVAVDWDGNDLADHPFTFNAQTPCILAANQRIADQILERLHRV